MNIFEIKEEIRKIFEEATDPETGEISEEAFENLEALQMARDEKIDNVACWYKNLVAEAEAIKAEEKKLKQRREVIERDAQRKKDYLAYALDGEKFSSPRVAISFRRSKKCIVEHPEWLDEKYLKYAAPTPNKEAITEALNKGEMIAGCRMEENLNVMIK